MRQLSHENLNTFVGLCIDGPQLISIWGYCIRGSLADVLQKQNLKLDWFFKYSLVRDLAEVNKANQNCKCVIRPQLGKHEFHVTQAAEEHQVASKCHKYYRAWSTCFNRP